MNNKQRAGVTLIEVLVAIFVTAIGLLSLMALFPVGAASMATALRNGRSAQAAANAHAIASVMNLSADTNAGVVSAFTSPTLPANLPALAVGTPGPSYPVYLDPSGLTAGNSLGAFQTNVPFPLVSPGMPRCTPSLASGTGATRWFSLLDDLAFNQDGTAAGSGTVQREGRYTYCYVLRRPSAFSAQVVDRTVVVYSGRSSVIPLESIYGPVRFDTASTTVTVGWVAGLQPPNIHNGGWVLDATVVQPNPSKAPGQPPFIGAPGHGYFYRVVSVGQATPNNIKLPTYYTMDLELQSPPKVNSYSSNGNAYGILVVLDNVVEVFERGATN